MGNLEGNLEGKSFNNKADKNRRNFYEDVNTQQHHEQENKHEDIQQGYGTYNEHKTNFYQDNSQQTQHDNNHQDNNHEENNHPYVDHRESIHHEESKDIRQEHGIYESDR